MTKVSFLSVYVIMVCSGLLTGLDVAVAVQDRVLDRYVLFIDQRNVHDITSFMGSDRDVAEMILLQKAIILGGFPNATFSFIENLPSVLRVISVVESGHADVSGTSIWKESLHDINIEQTLNLIEDNQFEVGVYVSPLNSKALSVLSIEGLRELSFVSSSQWIIDWETLTELRIERLEDITSWESMVHMIQHGRVDALLAPFQSSADLSMAPYGFKMVPIPGIKIGLSGQRCLIVSRRRSNSRDILHALNRGLAIMKKDGTLSRAYRECGFFNDRVVDWTLIVPER